MGLEVERTLEALGQRELLKAIDMTDFAATQICTAISVNVLAAIVKKRPGIKAPLYTIL